MQDVKTNVFCSSGMHLPNGSFVTFGGNGAVTKGGNVGSVLNDEGSASYDALYQDYDGGKAIRVLDPCSAGSDFQSTQCGWFDDPSVLAMQKRRWYSTAEPTAEGDIVIIGGFANGGYINRNYPNVDPEFEGGAAECTYEYYPANGRTATTMQFMINTSGLNSYPHTFLMPSGKMFVQANVSTGKSRGFIVCLCMYISNMLFLSPLESHFQRGNRAPRYARWSCSRISRIRSRRHAPSHTQEQL